MKRFRVENEREELVGSYGAPIPVGEEHGVEVQGVVFSCTRWFDPPPSFMGLGGGSAPPS